MKHLRHHLTYANVIATLALFLALGGAGAMAAAQLGARSVGERQLRPGAIVAEKIRKNAVTAPKIAAGAVQSGKLANSSVMGPKLANGAVGAEKIANGAIANEKLADGSVTGAKVDEASLGQVPSAAFADSAAFAASANPAAFAAVDQDGNVNTALSKGIGAADVKAGSEPGIYCVAVGGFAPRGAQATPRYNGSGGVGAFVTIGGTGSCPAPQIEVQMHNGGLVKAPFYVVVYR